MLTGQTSEPARSNPTQPKSRSEFQRELQRRTDAYFTKTGLPVRDVPEMYAKTAVILSWFAVSYWLLVFQATAWWQAVILSISLALAAAGIGFNIQHDGGHGAYSQFKVLNRCAGMMLDAIGGSSYIWKVKHNRIHHHFPNVVGVDTDIDLGWLGEIPPDGPLRGIHRFQCLYLWLLYGCLAVKWQLFDDFAHLLRGHIGMQRFDRPRGWTLLTFLGGKLFFFAMVVGLPATRHSICVVVEIYSLSAFVLGLTLSVVFQLAHCVREAEFTRSSGTTHPSWAVRQVESTVDFARDSRLLTWYLGGLNFQIEHHLFPRICHVHYPALAHVVEQTCREFGVRYFAHRYLSGALASHYCLLRGPRF